MTKCMTKITKNWSISDLAASEWPVKRTSIWFGYDCHRPKPTMLSTIPRTPTSGYQTPTLLSYFLIPPVPYAFAGLFYCSDAAQVHRQNSSLSRKLSRRSHLPNFEDYLYTSAGGLLTRLSRTLFSPLRTHATSGALNQKASPGQGWQASYRATPHDRSFDSHAVLLSFSESARQFRLVLAGR